MCTLQGLCNLLEWAISLLAQLIILNINNEIIRIDFYAFNALYALNGLKRYQRQKFGLKLLENLSLSHTYSI